MRESLVKREFWDRAVMVISGDGRAREIVRADWWGQFLERVTRGIREWSF